MSKRKSSPNDPSKNFKTLLNSKKLGGGGGGNTGLG